MYFYRHQAQIKVLKEFNFVVSSKPYKKMMDYLLQYSIRCEFSWKKDPTIRIEDIEGTLKDLIFIRSAVERILIIFPELAQK